MSNNSENENDSFDSLPDINMTTYEITFPRRRRNSDIPNSNSASSTSLASEMAAPNPNQKPDPLTYIKTDETCTICFDDDTEIKLVCKHSFHVNCINQWLKENETCPYCRWNVYRQPPKEDQ